MKTNQYLLLFSGPDWTEGMEPQEIREMMDRTHAWFDRLFSEGKAKGAQPLEKTGRTVTAKNGMIADGPFVESKESIGGYLLLEVADLEEALAIARENPMLTSGLSIEVRPVAEICPSVRAALEKTALATA
ncbi:MAG: YciI family protein [Luteolibacter sp.]